MSRHPTSGLLLPPCAIETLAAFHGGGLRAVLTLETAPRPVTLLDCFDRSLRRANLVLLETEDRLDLVTPQGGVLSQPANGERFVAGMTDGPVKTAIGDIAALRRLLPVMTGLFQSGELALLDEEEKTRARATLRLITNPAGQGALLVTPHGLRGYDKALHQLRQTLADAGGVPARGGDLHRCLAPPETPAAPQEVTIGRDDTAFDAACAIIDSNLAAARATEAGIIADLDTEFLHDYRVALRRVRSILSLFRNVYAQSQTREMKARFAALMAPTGQLRDLDVLLLARPGFLALVPEEMRPGLDAMFARLAAERQAEHARLAAHLRSAAYEREVAALTRLFAARRLLRHGCGAEMPAHDLACRLIWKRYRRIHRLARTIRHDTPDEAVHALRIQCKKLRYLMEFFAPVFPSARFAALLKPLKKLQDRLGAFNDCAVQQVSLRHHAAALVSEPAPQQVEIAQSVGALIAALHQRQNAERDRIIAAFRAFDDTRTREGFRALFHEGRENA